MKVVVRKLFLAGVVLTSILGFAQAPKDGGGGDGPGNTGDPFQFQVYDRAKFGLLKVKKKTMLSPELIAVLETATKKLTVDIDSNLATMGEVRPDERRGGRRVVFINPTIVGERFDRRREPIDLTQWTLHEVFQIEIDPTTKLAYDVDEEITRNLRFDEKEFERWLAENKNKTATLTPNERPIQGEYYSASGVFSEGIHIKHDESWDDYQIGDVRKRTKEYFSTDVGNPFLNIEFKEIRNNRQLWTLRDEEPVKLEVSTKYKKCSFSYKIYILFNLDSFSIEENFPKMAINDAGRCVEVGDGGGRHQSEYYLAARYLHRAYAHVAKSEVEKAEKWKFFEAVARQDYDTVDEMIAEGTPVALEDWRGRTPLMIAAWLGDARLFEALAPLSNLTKVSDDKQDIFWFITKSNSKLEVQEAMYSVLTKLAPKGLNLFPIVNYAFSNRRYDFFRGIFGDGSNQALNTLVVYYFDSQMNGDYRPNKEPNGFLMAALRGGIDSFSGTNWNLHRMLKWMVQYGHPDEFELLSGSASRQPDREILVSQFLEHSKEKCADCDKFSTALVKLAVAGISPDLIYRLLARVISRKDVKGYRAFVIAEISIGGVDADQKNIAMWLAQYGMKADLEQALTVIDAKAVTRSKQTALSFAVGNHLFETAKFLYDKSDLDQLVGETQAPLFIHAAASMSNIATAWGGSCYNCVKKEIVLPQTLDILKLLMEDKNHPVDPKAFDIHGKSALDYATEKIWSATSGYSHYGRDPKHEAYFVEVYRYLVSKGVPHYKTAPPKPRALGIEEQPQSQPVYSQPYYPQPYYGGKKGKFR